MLSKSFEQNSEQSEDNSVDISRKYLDDDEPVVDESTRESRTTPKDVEEDLPREKSKRSVLRVWIRNKRTSGAVEILQKYIQEFKTKCEFYGVDFEADLSTMCS